MGKLNPSLQESLNAFLATDYGKIEYQDEAGKAIDALTKLHERIAGAIEDELADLAVKFKIDVYLGDYGTGRSVQIEEDEWSDYAVGEWVPSSARC